MANWETSVSASSFDAKSFANKAMEQRDAARSKASQWTIGGVGNMNVVGINASKVPEMREQIRTSVSNLQSKIDAIGTDLSSDKAYRSSVIKPEVDAYIEAVKTYCKALISDLLAFSDKLKDVQDAWEASTSAIASESINSSTTNMSGYSTYYTESK